MANDASVPTLVEDWFVTEIKSIVGINAEFVDFFDGLDEYMGDAKTILEELSRRQGQLFIEVRFAGRRFEDREEENYDSVATFAVHVMVRNQRRGASRRGDGTTLGTNGYADLLKLHFETQANLRPSITDATATFTTERLRLVTQTPPQVFPRGMSLFTMTFEVREVGVTA